MTPFLGAFFLRAAARFRRVLNRLGCCDRVAARSVFSRNPFDLINYEGIDHCLARFQL